MHCHGVSASTNGAKGMGEVGEWVVRGEGGGDGDNKQARCISF